MDGTVKTLSVRPKNDDYAPFANGVSMSFSDIDECSSANECHQNATCNNTKGSYNCTCKDGFEGNGKNCTGKTVIERKNKQVTEEEPTERKIQ